MNGFPEWASEMELCVRYSKGRSLQQFAEHFID